MIIYEDNDLKVECGETPELQELVYKKCLEWFVKQKVFAGEVLMQSDDPIISAPEFLADLADDVFKFKETRKDV